MENLKDAAVFIRKKNKYLYICIRNFGMQFFFYYKTLTHIENYTLALFSVFFGCLIIGSYSANCRA
ncbi:MAG: hypothetical protein CRN43_05510 [Candidatus Nephrothrix sp. EaCA]|nr:MAG: hypothetical protein CRN43_05510 [Candidatus Nephrothrix sp. EaCA]